MSDSEVPKVEQDDWVKLEPLGEDHHFEEKYVSTQKEVKKKRKGKGLRKKHKTSEKYGWFLFLFLLLQDFLFHSKSKVL